MPAETRGAPARDLTLSDFPFLASLADSADPKDRRIWLRVACDHFVASDAADPEAVERFADAVLRQIETADAATVLEAALKLAPCARTPRRLIAALRSASPAASDLVLERGAALTTADLVDAAASGARQAIAVARRADLDAETTDALIAGGDADALVALAANPHARLEGARLADLTRRARSLAEGGGDRRLADALLRLKPVRTESAALFLIAGPLQRVDILLAAQRAQLGRPPSAAAPLAPEVVEALELAALARHPDRFVAALGKALDCDLALAEAIADDPSGEPLAVALAALGAPNDVVVRLLIAGDLESGENYRRIRALARLNSALTRNAAMMVMAALRGEPAARPRPAPPVDAPPLRETVVRRPARPVASPAPRKAAG